MKYVIAGVLLGCLLGLVSTTLVRSPAGPFAADLDCPIRETVSVTVKSTTKLREHPTPNTAKNYITEDNIADLDQVEETVFVRRNGDESYVLQAVPINDGWAITEGFFC